MAKYRTTMVCRTCPKVSSYESMAEAKRYGWSRVKRAPYDCDSINLRCYGDCQKCKAEQKANVASN